MRLQRGADPHKPWGEEGLKGCFPGQSLQAEIRASGPMGLEQSCEDLKVGVWQGCKGTVPTTAPGALGL